VLSPQLGYENATKVAKYARKQNCSVRQAVVDLELMTEADFDAALGDLVSIAKRAR
jgi:fumarate hydratase class II